MKNKKYLWIGVITAFAFTIVMNILANAIPINGQNTGQISDLYPSSFTPAGFTFSIWGLIYLSLLIFTGFQAFPKQRSKPHINKIQFYFIINALANGIWILFWHYNLVLLSFMVILIILSTLVAIYRVLYLERDTASITDLICLHFPFSLYFGWITVATIANFTALQFSMGWESIGWSDEHWTLIKLAIAGAIAAMMILRHRDVVFVSVTGWAAYGILSKHSENLMVYGAALTLAFLVGLLIIFEILKWMINKGNQST